jgi:hypothetical protein
MIGIRLLKELTPAFGLGLTNKWDCFVLLHSRKKIPVNLLKSLCISV